MSAKLLSAFTDENPDLRNQIGCMSGIIQMFDRHHLLSGKRLGGQNHHKRSLSGNLRAEPHAPAVRVLDQKLSRSSKENHRASVDSSRPSFSSSSDASSFSSLDCNKSSQQESFVCDGNVTSLEIPLSSIHRIRPGIDTELEHYCAPCSSPINESAQSIRRSNDFQDFVKDAICGDWHAPSVKTYGTVVTKKNIARHNDFTRHLSLSKSKDASYDTGFRGRSFTELGESLANLRESAWSNPSSNEAQNCSLFSFPKEVGRFSCDSRHNNESASELPDYPRLSLDSRDSYKGSLIFVPKLDSVLKGLERSHSNQRFSQHHSGFHSRPPSVVAKLMGLDVLPNLINTSASQWELTRSTSCKDYRIVKDQRKTNGYSKSMNVGGETNKYSSPQNSKDLDSQRRKVGSRVQEDRQQENALLSPKIGFRNREGSMNEKNESLHGKKLHHLEILQTSKNGRAVKQVLNPIQTKRVIEIDNIQHKLKGKEPERSKNCRNTHNSSHLKSTTKKSIKDVHPIPTSITGANSSKPSVSSIVIMKPAKTANTCDTDTPPSILIPLDHLNGLRKIQIRNQPSKDKTLNSNAKETLGQNHSSRNKPIIYGNGGSSPKRLLLQKTVKSNGGSMETSVSPRVQQKKSHSMVTSLGPIQSQAQSKGTRQPSESVSPKNKLKMKPITQNKNPKDLDQTSCDTWNCSYQSNAGSSLESQFNEKATTTAQIAWINSNSFQSGWRLNHKAEDTNNSNTAHKLEDSKEDGSFPKAPTMSVEQSSPISVLDGSFYKDKPPPSQIKKIVHSFKEFGDTSGKNDEDSGERDGAISSFPQSSSSLVIDHEKHRVTESQDLKLKQLSSSLSEAAATSTSTAPLYDSLDPDHQYVTEILFASGLLFKGFNDHSNGTLPIKMHRPPYVINPNLFSILEQRRIRCIFKPGAPSCEDATDPDPGFERITRNLIFDAVNEILVRMLGSERLGPWPLSCFSPGELAGKAFSGQSLVKELFSELDQLRNEGVQCGGLGDADDDKLELILSRDVERQTAEWSNVRREISVFVLDIERLIFKDLVDEVFSSE